MSPRWNAGSILPLSTTTTGDSLLVKNMRPFQIISAEKTIMARLRPWCSRRRLFFHSFLSSAIWSSTISSILSSRGYGALLLP
jgi:hypothetical protein